MATITGSGSVGPNSYFKHEWTLGNADDGAPIARGDLSDKTVQVWGTFGGATVVIEGSMDGTTWATLKSPLDAALSFTAAGLAAILENPEFIRPRSSGGTGTAVKVAIGARSRA